MRYLVMVGKSRLELLFVARPNNERESLGPCWALVAAHWLYSRRVVVWYTVLHPLKQDQLALNLLAGADPIRSTLYMG